jgi:hypothetical protein
MRANSESFTYCLPENEVVSIVLAKRVFASGVEMGFFERGIVKQLKRDLESLRPGIALAIIPNEYNPDADTMLRHVLNDEVTLDFGEMNFQWYVFAVDTSGNAYPPMHTRPAFPTGVQLTKGSRIAAKAISDFLDEVDA